MLCVFCCTKFISTKVCSFILGVFLSPQSNTQTLISSKTFFTSPPKTSKSPFFMSFPLPPAFVSRLQYDLGSDEALALQNALQTNPPISIRHNPHKFFPNNPHLSLTNAVPWCDKAYYLAQRPLFTADPLFHAGCYYVQEAASMFLEHIWQQFISSLETVCVLDACAAPGGKSTLLASLLNKQSCLVSNEVVRPRANVLAENMTKWGSTNTFVTCNTPQDLGKLHNFFDVVVVDAPCSGEGMFRKDPAAIQEWTSQSNAFCSQRQRHIVADLYPCLANNGYLIYSTCTFSKQENEDIVRYLVENYAMTCLQIPLLPEWNIIESQETLPTGENIFGYHFYPHLTTGEGFFVACLQKTAEEYPTTKSKNKNKNPQKNTTSLSLAQQKSYLSNYLAPADDFVPLMDGDTLFAIPQCLQNAAQTVMQSLYCLKKGIEIGTLKGKDLVPSVGVALSHCLSPTLPRIALSQAQAIAYLRREEVVLPDACPIGWCLVQYEGHCLGWIKVLSSGRCNNYYPTHWKIRMNIEV